MTPRQLLTAIGFLAALVSLTIFMIIIETDESVVVPTWGTSSSPPPTIVDLGSTSRTKIVSRLREILRIRERAYRSRNSDVLKSIYSRDCPCLSSDKSAIDELLREKRAWDGIGTSLEVRRATKLNERVWTVVGLFRSEALYVRMEDGRLVWREPAGKDLFRFTLVKPQGEPHWLLGLVSVLRGP